VRVLVPVVLALLALGRRPACAWMPVNTETLRDPSVDGWTGPLGGWTGALGGDVAFETGNVDLLEVGLDARVDVRDGPRYAFAVGRVR
jgi:hypothetical protein